jgi:hypothetical protein
MASTTDPVARVAEADRRQSSMSPGSPRSTLRLPQATRRTRCRQPAGAGATYRERTEDPTPLRREREPAESLWDESNALGGWLPSLIFPGGGARRDEAPTAQGDTRPVLPGEWPFKPADWLVVPARTFLPQPPRQNAPLPSRNTPARHRPLCQPGPSARAVRAGPPARMSTMRI